MILTVTPNPSVDRTVFLEALIRGSVNRSVRSWSEPSGKGVNVALALRAHERPHPVDRRRARGDGMRLSACRRKRRRKGGQGADGDPHDDGRSNRTRTHGRAPRARSSGFIRR
jgi:hypothetical protein